MKKLGKPRYGVALCWSMGASVHRIICFGMGMVKRSLLLAIDPLIICKKMPQSPEDYTAISSSEAPRRGRTLKVERQKTLSK